MLFQGERYNSHTVYHSAVQHKTEHIVLSLQGFCKSEYVQSTLYQAPSACYDKNKNFLLLHLYSSW